MLTINGIKYLKKGEVSSDKTITHYYYTDTINNTYNIIYKGKNAKSQNGIGLSICDEITKLHKGTLKIDSKENEGTRITISIPIEVEERA